MKPILSILNRIFILFWFSLISTYAYSEGLASNEDWRELKSSRFIVIYPDRLNSLAHHAISAAETAMTELDNTFSEPLNLPVTIIMSDQSDYANGFATYMPYPYISISTATPLPTDSIDAYSHWFYLLILHELTHLYTFRPAHGIYAPLKYLFGSIVYPNGLLPRWYEEGLAVEMESRSTTKGRLRSSSTYAALRALSTSKDWKKEDISRINESGLATYPDGQRPYLFGSIIWHDLAENYGIKSADDQLQRFGRRLPYLLNGPIEDLADKNWITYWSDLQNRIRKNSQQQISLIKRTGEMKLSSVSDEAGQQILPTVSPDGSQFAYLGYSHNGGAYLYVHKKGERKSFTKLQVIGVTRISWLNDSAGLVFDQVNLVNRYYNYRDLFTWDLDPNHPAQAITHGERVREPIISPSGNHVIYISNQAGVTSLREIDLDSREVKEIMSSKLGSRMSLPIYISENNIAVLYRNTNGTDQIVEINKTNLKKRILFNNQGAFMGLKYSQGRFFYLSDSTGVFNLFEVKNSGKPPQALTNSPTQISYFDLDFQNKQLYLSQLTAEGPKIYLGPITYYDPPSIEIPDYGRFAQSGNTEANPNAPVQTTDDDYNPWRYMLPNYWVPYVFPVENGVLFQGLTSASDPAAIHSYDLSLSHDTVTNLTSYGFNYLNSKTPVTIGAHTAQTNELVSSGSSLVISNNYYALSSNGFFYNISSRWKWSLGASTSHTELPLSTGLYKRDRLGFSGALNYSSSRGLLITPSWGEVFGSIGGIHFLENQKYLGYDRFNGQIGAKLRGFIPDQHTLIGNIKASYTNGFNFGDTVPLGERTIGGNYLFSLINSTYLVRGYPSGQFVGRNIVNASLEYAFPLLTINKGSGTKPIFFRNLDMALFVDSVAVDGGSYSNARKGYARSYLGEFYTGVGSELQLKNTVGYHFPFAVNLGLYYGLDNSANGGFSIFLGFGYTGFGGLGDGHKPDTFPNSL